MSERLRIVHVVASVDDEAAGPSVSVPRLAEAQARAGHQVTLATVATGTPSLRNLAPSVTHRRHPPALGTLPFLSRLTPSAALRRDLLARAAETDIVHGHGLWLMPNIYPADMTPFGARYVVAPRGMLGADALKFSWHKKRLFHNLVQRSALAKAALFHATSEVEVNDIREFGLTAPAAMVPNGVDLPPALNPAEQLALRAKPRTILSLGRIHPKKGLDRLVRAFALVKKPGWCLRIVGPSELGYAQELARLAADLDLEGITIEGPVFGADKLASYRAASLFVLPTLHENFAMTVAEALAAGTPVISTKGAPWRSLEREGCGLWVDHGSEPLARALAELMELTDAERAAMGARGRAYMARDYSWDGVAARMLEAYRWTLHGCDAPPSVRFS